MNIYIRQPENFLEDILGFIFESQRYYLTQITVMFSGRDVEKYSFTLNL